jgi:hypothetical protein
MKDKILKIANDLEINKINEFEAKIRLFKLFEVDSLLFNEGDLITNGYQNCKLMTKPKITADILWVHNGAYDENVNVGGFFI